MGLKSCMNISVDDKIVKRISMDCCKNLQKYLDDLFKWSHYKKIVFTPKKCQALGI